MEKRMISFWGKRILLITLLVAVLAGCSGLSLGLGGKPVTLRFVYIENAADYEPLAQEFHRQHPNITVTLDPVSHGRDMESNLAAKADGADAIRIPMTMLQDQMAANFLPLDMQISTAKNFPQSDLIPGALEGLQVSGKQLGLPAGIDPFVVFYSPQKFASAGVQPPPPNWTMDEFVKTAMAINNTNEALVGSPQYTYGFCSHPSFTDLAIFTYLFGGGLFDSLTTISHPTLNRRENVDALTWYASLKTDMGIIPDMSEPRQVGELVARSNCGFWIDWLDRSTFGNYGPDDATALPLPAYKGQFNVALLDGYFLFTKSQNPDEAWQWINFLIGQQSASGRLIPPLKSLIDSQDYAGRVPKGTLNVARSLPQQMVVLGLEMYQNQRFGKVLELFATATTQVFSGEKGPQAALDEAQKQAEDAFR